LGVKGEEKPAGTGLAEGGVVVGKVRRDRDDQAAGKKGDEEGRKKEKQHDKFGGGLAGAFSRAGAKVGCGQGDGRRRAENKERETPKPGQEGRTGRIRGEAKGQKAEKNRGWGDS